jgi:hypothetical protein
MRTFGAFQHQELINSISAVATGEYVLPASGKKCRSFAAKEDF